MDNALMIKKLKNAGVSFTSGLTCDETVKIESTFGFRFPKEIKSFLSCAYPVGREFFDYREFSASNLQKFDAFQKRIEDAFLFDLDHCEDLLKEKLAELFTDASDRQNPKKVVLDALHRSTKLIPFYAHRCFFDGMDDMPIVSFWQAVDTIFYGSDFENYLENEFLVQDHVYRFGEISERMKETGIWYYLVE